MSNDSTDRTIKGGVWVLKEEYDIDNIILKDELLSDYMIALMEVAAADGVLSEAERQWVIGLACAIGSSQVVIDKLQTYQHKGMDSVLATFHAESGHSNGIHRQLSLIYDGFRAAGADGELHPKEVEAIHELAKALGVGEAQVKQLYELYIENQQNRLKRLKIIFPNGGNHAIAEVEKLY
ncbi:unnamed protein product [Rotaria sp. Silwood2]|nr:unnamed protein product [Rotaria sp. Silwood2]